ncbi:hypothetical protein AR457_23760 [Streptomyces agglomeratus]|uniref:GerMN domain-containing protein n=1 Tax=Streptomyces agglomeratus TaxID=285458 RepID=A0A1E5PBZ3_9ACTN|nr:hypothetical protein [Streptomyces agglomeratus]OEJ27027.1 hypothetical protein AS594_23640 [Streptomyces agglomeratus]OEJ38923.1 hypothetical protein BGK70_12895 [Streptomyces agglomeratus]OEJ46693.1 hypothetical protein AR457_23760 [Streptomyces agglomeratus]OEJ51452.1 hypothetical protein BGK72_12365 [Streptomyces agglomeratus]OEJ58854.1 hypothetical protein BGM19_13465 [Streptomyces agglomeratus]
MRRVRGGAAAWVSASLLLLAGCGIQASEVVEAGGPAVVPVVPDQLERMLLFFVGPDGRPIPVARPLDVTDVPSPTARTLDALLGGPTEEERAVGITTRLPAAAKEIEVVPADREDSGPGREAGAPDAVRVTTGFAVRSLDAAAVRQLVCTAAHAEDPEGLVKVALTGSDGSLPATACS